MTCEYQSLMNTYDATLTNTVGLGFIMLKATLRPNTCCSPDTRTCLTGDTDCRKSEHMHPAIKTLHFLLIRLSKHHVDKLLRTLDLY